MAGAENRKKRGSRLRENTRFVARVFLGICLSIFIHVVLSVITYRAGDLYGQDANKKILVEWVDATKPEDMKWDDPTGQVVRQAKPPPELLTNKDLQVKRRFLSEEKQTVLDERRAAASGMTANRNGSAPTNETQDIAKFKPSKKGVKTYNPDDLAEVVPNSVLEEGIGDVLRERKKDVRRHSVSESRELYLPTDPRRSGMSTSGEQLPSDIRIGDFTALNTDRFLYYTFYARIEELIRYRWIKYVRAAMYGGQVPDGKEQFVTRLEIILDRRGDFQQAIVHATSGANSLDSAAVMAFRETQRIPHPPREMIKDDGTIRLFYSFQVDNVPRVARGKTAQDADDHSNDN